LRRQDKTGCDAKKYWKEGVCGQKASKQEELTCWRGQVVLLVVGQHWVGGMAPL